MDKKSPKGRKRSSKGASLGSAGEREDSFWDCSVCTFRNNAEAFKCGVCDVRKGTSTRKPRINPDMVAAQQAQAVTPPPTSSTPTPSSSSALRDDEDDVSSERTTPSRPGGKKPKDSYKSEDVRVPPANGSVKKIKIKDPQKKAASTTKARLKNVDRSSATYHSVTVNDITVVITEFKPKAKKDKKERKEKNGADSSPNGSLSVKASGNNSESNSVDTSNQENVVRNAAESVVNGSRSS